MTLRKIGIVVSLTALIGSIVWWYGFSRVSPWPPEFGKRYPSQAEFITTEGAPIRMSAYRGKYVVIHYIEPGCAADLGNVKSLSEQFEWRSEGQSGKDPRIIWVEVLLSSLRNSPPTMKDLQEWEATINPQRQRRPIMLGVSPKLTSPRYAQKTYQTHGIQLLDRKGIVRADVTGSAPKHYWPGIVERLSYWLRTSSDEDPPAGGSTIADPADPILSIEQRTDCLSQVPPDLTAKITDLAVSRSLANSNQGQARIWLEMQRNAECLRQKLSDIYIAFPAETDKGMVSRCAKLSANQQRIESCPFLAYTRPVSESGIPIRLLSCESEWRFELDPIGYQKYLELWPDGPSVEEAKAGVERASDRKRQGCLQSPEPTDK